MRAKEYIIMEQAIHEGIAYGWNRAHKHVDNPTEENIKEAIEIAVMNSICEYFEFDNREKDYEE